MSFYTKNMITSTYFKKVSDGTKDEYVTRVNNWYVSLAASYDVKEADLQINLPDMIKELLTNKLLMLYSLDHMEPSANGMSFYQLMYATAKDSYAGIIKNVSAKLMTGTVTSESTTSVFGRRVR
jgi:hypothetical protein